MATNIQVVVRCRERSQREINAKSPIVVDLPCDTYSTSNASITVSPDQQITNLINSKTYIVDQVYGSLADQHLVFEKVALPLFDDFVKGYNVTILAYGQTGTGKTYTMCGDCGRNPHDTESDMGEVATISELAGIIPRTLNELFRVLDSSSDYMIKCSFIELYNEELKDLLNDDNEKNKLRMFETRKPNGHNELMILNLREVYINNSLEGLNALKKGISKRTTATTKLNEVSSRSHTIFTINLYKQQDNDCFRMSKMNLVDLAGSENINRSGAINHRAKEAGMINQSLLTLGRVINSLSEKSSSNPNIQHIPYRESKLTRLLQDSVGGETKTALIATISPAKVNIEETVSTLEYASRAKNIQNKPQVGQDCNFMIKKILVKEMSREIAKIHNDLLATRNKNGIWMDEANHRNLLRNEELLKAEIKESQSVVNGLQLKIELLCNSKKIVDRDNKSYKDRVHEYEQRLNNSERDMEKLKLLLQSKDQENEGLHEKMSRVILNIKKSKLALDSLISSNINNSISRIESILTTLSESRTNESHQMDSIVQGIKMTLKSSKEDIIGALTSVDEKMKPSLEEFRESLLSVYENTKNFDELFRNSSSGISNSISNLKDADEKYMDYIKESHLDPNLFSECIERVVIKRVNDKLLSMKKEAIENITTLLENAYSQQEGIVRDSMEQVYPHFMRLQKETLIQYLDERNKTTVDNYKSLSEHLTFIGDRFTTLRDLSSDRLTKSMEKVDSLTNESVPSLLNDINRHAQSHLGTNDINNLRLFHKNLQERDLKLLETLQNINEDLERVNNNTFIQDESPRKSEHASYLDLSPSKTSRTITSVFPKKAVSPQKDMDNLSVANEYSNNAKRLPLKNYSLNNPSSQLKAGGNSLSFPDSKRIDKQLKKRKFSHTADTFKEK